MKPNRYLKSMTQREIQISYCNFIGRNWEKWGLCSFDKIPKGYYNDLFNYKIE